MSQLPPGFVLDDAPASAPQGGPVYGPAPVVKPQSPAELERLEIARQAAQLAQDKFDYQRQQDAAKTTGGATTDPKLQAKMANLEALTGQINRVQQLYDANLKEEAFPLISSLLEYLPTPTNRQFDSAAAGMAEQGLAAFRVPGVGAQSDTELRQFVEANKPAAADSDLAIEEKLLQLRARVDATRAAMGLPPAQWASGAAPAEQDDPAAMQAGDDQAPPGFGGGFLQAADGRTAGRTRDGGDDETSAAVATDEFRREDNPTLAGVRAEYLRRLERGDSASQIIAWAREAGIDPSANPSIARQVQFRRENPGVPLEEYDTSQMDDRFVPVSGFERAAGTLADNPVGAGIVGAADAITGFNLDSLAGLAGGNAERARLGMGAIAERNPVSTFAGNMAGGIGTALAGEVALGARIASPLARSLTADGAYGALAGAGMTDYAADGTPATVADRATGAGIGTLSGLVGSYAGNKVGGALQGVARGVSDPAVQSMQDAGIPMTLGQVYANSGRTGSAIKSVEDRLSGIPVVGDVVNARRTEGVAAFNSKAFDKALEPIGGSVGDTFGEEAVEVAQRQVSDAFEAALSGKVAPVDQTFAADFTNAVTRTMALPRVGEEVADGVKAILEPYMQAGAASIDGPTMQQISRELRGLKASYVNDPLKKRIGESIDAVEESIFGVFKRHTPEVLPAYNQAKAAARRLYILEDAVLKARNRPEGGQAMFTPAQLGMADRANAKKFGGASSAARGDTPFFDYQRSAQSVLPNNVPDSGTAGRLILPAAATALVGADAATGDAGVNPGTLGLAAILAGAYTKAGQRVLTKPGRGMKQGTARRRVLESDKTRRAIGASSAAGGVALSNQQ